MTEEEFKIAKRRGNIAAIIAGIIMIILFMNSCASTASCANSNYHKTYTLCPAYH